MDKPEQLFSLYVASCSGMSNFDCPFGFLSMLPVALVCPFLIAPFVFSLCWQLQTRTTGNIERKPKGQSKMDK
jgi:hypothetical protein